MMPNDQDTGRNLNAMNWTPSFPPTGIALDQNAALSAAVLDRLQLPANQVTPNGIVPTAPYYSLPAGLMVPLVEPTQTNYRPLKPADLRLPLPKFPDERFLKVIDDYYGNDGEARDNDGWDRSFIDTYINQKKALAETAKK